VQVKIIAAILERAVIDKILTHLGLDPQPPPRSQARGAWLEFAACEAGGPRGHPPRRVQRVSFAPFSRLGADPPLAPDKGEGV
jgi:hypothetical protein